MQRGFTLIEIAFALGIVGVIAALATASFGSFKCTAAQSEAKLALQAVMTLESDYFARYGTYADVRSPCPSGGSGTPPSSPCVAFESKGQQSYRISGTGTATGFTATAVGIAGTRSAGSVWQVDHEGNLSDLARTCGSAP